MDKISRQHRPKRKTLLIFFKILGLCFLVSFLAISLLVIFYAHDLPRPEKFTEREINQSTKIYDRTGKILLYEIYGEEKRTLVSLGQIPDYLQKAVLAAEDSGFYRHFGVSPKAILRAILADLHVLKLTQGASTISQQLIRNSYLSPEKTGARKTKEIILSLELERRYSKNQILEFYLNQVPFGQNSYGVEAASQTFFRKEAKDLSLPESAVLASLIKAPSYLSPYGLYKEELIFRKDYVLDRMADLEFITKEQATEAKSAPLNFAKPLQGIKSPHFVVFVKDYLEKKYGEDFLKEKGLKVYTSLDWDLQQFAEETVKEVSEVNEEYRAYNAALVVINPQSGEILSLIGSKDFFAESFPKDCLSGKNCLFEPQFNVALSPRQPGSSFKPFVYATAFNKGYGDKTIVNDGLTNFGVWGGKEYIPRNYDGVFRGNVTLRQALAQSLNIPAVKTLMDLAGLPESIKTAQDLGITTLKPPFGPSIVLGGYEVTLLEMVSAYGVFAADGSRVKPVFILKIEDDQGNILEEYDENQKTLKRVLETRTARLINSILSDNLSRAPIFGLHSPLFFEGYQVAAKTGTTQDYRDGWAIGYTPSIVVGAWVGNNDNSPTGREPGIVLAGPIFHRVLLHVIENLPKTSFPLPD